MSLFRMIRFFSESAGYLECNAEDESHRTAHRGIVRWATALGVTGLVLGIAASVGAITGHRGNEFPIIQIVMMPLLFTAAGMLIGAALGCLFAPREFLEGPAGAKWMALIGTRNVTVARVVCLAFGLLVTLPFVLLGILIALNP